MYETMTMQILMLNILFQRECTTEWCSQIETSWDPTATSCSIL